MYDWLTFFFFNDTATTEIYTLSLHDALPISGIREAIDLARSGGFAGLEFSIREIAALVEERGAEEVKGLFAEADRKSTRLNSSHANISYAVFCLKKKKNATYTHPMETPITND